MQNLCTHNIIKTEHPKSELSQKALLTNIRLETAETECKAEGWAVCELINKKAVQTYLIPVLSELLAL